MGLPRRARAPGIGDAGASAEAARGRHDPGAERRRVALRNRESDVRILAGALRESPLPKRVLALVERVRWSAVFVDRVGPSRTARVRTGSTRLAAPAILVVAALVARWWEGVRPESLFAVAFVGGVVECLPVGAADAFALAVGQLGGQVAQAVNGAVLAL